MNEDNLLNFNYKLLPDQNINIENEIKQEMRDNSLNEFEENDIKRYSDKYITNSTYTTVIKSLDIEILPFELQMMYGFNCSKDLEAVVGEEIEDNSESVSQEKSESSSLHGGDDYHDNYYDDEELVNEPNERDFGDVF